MNGFIKKISQKLATVTAVYRIAWTSVAKDFANSHAMKFGVKFTTLFQSSHFDCQLHNETVKFMANDRNFQRPVPFIFMNGTYFGGHILVVTVELSYFKNYPKRWKFSKVITAKLKVMENWTGSWKKTMTRAQKRMYPV